MHKLNVPLIRPLRLICFLLFTAVTFCACSSGNKKTANSAAPQNDSAVDAPAAIFHNYDSIVFYMEQAYLHGDPKAHFVVGACYYLHEQGDLPEDIPYPAREEADSMLIVAASQNYQPAKDLIHCLQENNAWHHDFPVNKE
ncbi:MAG: hypothetical protein ACI4AI_05455 [Paludibacteraceae bacterium]